MPATISARNLGKRYRVNHAQERAPYRTLRDTLSRAATAPLRRLRGETSGAREEFWALKDVSFDIQPGEVVGIIGRNGAGKSTLLKILSRITKPTTGEVEINGRVGSLLEVGTGFHQELTGRENVYMNGSILGMSRREIDRRFDEIVDFAEIERFLDTPVKRYSSGMYVRLAFAVAAHLDPELLIIDEVLAVGDAEFQQKCLGKMQDAARGGRTVIFVSHNMAAVRNLCTSAYVIDHGSVAFEGKPETAINHYLESSDAHTRSNETDASTIRERHGDGRIRLEKTRMRDQDGSVEAAFRVGAPFEVELDFNSTVASRSAIVGITVKDALGIELFTTNSNDRGELLDIDVGHFRCSVKIDPCYLKAGRYSIQVGLVAGGLSDLVPHAHSFEIVPNRNLSRSVLTQQPGSLFFDYPWSLAALALNDRCQ
jgi:homopolymeric O-antigen transport system ATP-binding protein